MRHGDYFFEKMASSSSTSSSAAAPAATSLTGSSSRLARAGEDGGEMAIRVPQSADTVTNSSRRRLRGRAADSHDMNNTELRDLGNNSVVSVHNGGNNGGLVGAVVPSVLRNEEEYEEVEPSSFGSKRGKKLLTLQDKVNIITEYNNSFVNGRPMLTCSKLAEKYRCSRQNINQLLDKQEQIMAFYHNGGNLHSARINIPSSSMAQLHSELREFIKSQQQAGSGRASLSAIFGKANEIAARLEMKAYSGKSETPWKANKGWWSRLCESTNMYTHGVVDDYDAGATENGAVAVSNSPTIRRTSSDEHVADDQENANWDQENMPALEDRTGMTITEDEFNEFMARVTHTARSFGLGSYVVGPCSKFSKSMKKLCEPVESNKRRRTGNSSTHDPGVDSEN
jgi:hypothetical protein